MKKIGALWGGDMSDVARFRDPFRKKLRDLGYVEGQEITIVDQYAEGDDNPNQLQQLANELVGIPVDVIVSSGTPVSRAAAAATINIPIVFAAVGDPIEVPVQGRNNITGVRLPGGLSANRLIFLKTAISTVTRVAVLRNQRNPVHERYYREMEDAALGLGIVLQQHLALADLDALDPADSPHALIVLPDPKSHSERAKTMMFATKKKLPAVYSQRNYTEEGGLMSYGPNYPAMFQQAAELVSRILSGTPPSALQIIVATPERVLNRNAARQIGVDIDERLFNVVLD
jgi:putative tryptophan/tyrosine transport system substrate-binding protein